MSNSIINKYIYKNSCEVLFDQEIKINLYKSCVVTLFFNVQTQHNKKMKQRISLFQNNWLPCFINK